MLQNHKVKIRAELDAATNAATAAKAQADRLGLLSRGAAEGDRALLDFKAGLPPALFFLMKSDFFFSIFFLSSLFLSSLFFFFFFCSRARTHGRSSFRRVDADQVRHVRGTLPLFVRVQREVSRSRAGQGERTTFVCFLSTLPQLCAVCTPPLDLISDLGQAIDPPLRDSFSLFSACFSWFLPDLVSTRRLILLFATHCL